MNIPVILGRVDTHYYPLFSKPSCTTTKLCEVRWSTSIIFYRGERKAFCGNTWLVLLGIVKYDYHWSVYMFDIFIVEKGKFILFFQLRLYG